jgi:hypothetical protein
VGAGVGAGDGAGVGANVGAGVGAAIGTPQTATIGDEQTIVRPAEMTAEMPGTADDLATTAFTRPFVFPLSAEPTALAFTPAVVITAETVT